MNVIKKNEAAIDKGKHSFSTMGNCSQIHSESHASICRIRVSDSREGERNLSLGWPWVRNQQGCWGCLDRSQKDMKVWPQCALWTDADFDFCLFC